MMRWLLLPELLLLIVPLLALVWWRGRTSSPLGTAVRVVIVALLVLLAAIPLARVGGQGVDVVVIVDASRSMPAESDARSFEIVKLVEEQRGAGDRLGVVTFGREARVERLPEALTEIASFVQEVDREGSDLGGAITLAASLIPPDRPGRLVVLSDGESNGSSVTAAAHEAAARGLVIDYRGSYRPDVADIAVDVLDVPGRIDEREPFQFSAAVRADRTTQAQAVLSRDGVEIAREARTFTPGVSQLVFRDLVDRPGIARYRLTLRAAEDRIPENNIGEAAVNVAAPSAILLVNASGKPDNLSRALATGKLPVRIVTPAQLPNEPSALLPYRAVILENVPATAIAPPAMTALTRFTSDLGGGLLLTGGRASFGVGGYFRSELDPYLPVSMEIKNEHRKLSMAMAVALDRSGSMTAAVGDGRTKMDLANAGTCAAIETLGPFDEIAVLAVDSAAHVVTPLAPADDKEQVCNRVRGISAGGGGIFTYTALVEAARQVQESEKGTRHIVLFADAADAEEPGEYIRLLERLQSIGITVSVIGLGSEADVDAEFLKDVAKRGGGRALFTANVSELPQLFAQEAITVARSSFIEAQTPARTVADMVLLGELPATPFPTLDGYNLSYLRPGATMGVVTTDEYRAPVLAFWHRGLGRIASLSVEVDGEFSGRLNAWSGFPAFTVGLGRWLMGGEPPVGVQATLDRRGGEGIVRLELDPDRARTASDVTRTAEATLIPPGDRSAPHRVTLNWIGEDILEARFPLQRAGTYVGAVRLPTGEALPLAPLSLPYSPEFEPRPDAEEGRRTLREMARVTGGVERTTWNDVYSAAQLRDRQLRDLVLPLALLVLIAHVAEIGGRRLLLFPAIAAWVRGLRLPRWRRAGRWTGTRVPSSPAPASSPALAPAAAAAAVTAITAAPGATSSAPPLASPRESALSRAKSKAKNRVKR